MINPGKLGYQALHALCQNVPRPLATKVLPALAHIYKRADEKHRLHVERNLAVLGDYLKRDTSQLVDEVFFHFACFIYEFFSFNNDRLTQFASDQSMEKKLRDTFGSPGEKAGLILVNHHGNWEIALKKVLALGYPMMTVALHHGNAGVDDFFNQMRSHPGLRVSYLEEGTGPCLQAIEEKRLLALACERDYTGRGVDVELAGKSVTFPVGPAYLHHKTGVKLARARMTRLEIDAFDILLEPIEIPDSVYKCTSPIESLTRHIAQSVFSLIYECPEQWITFDDFFKLKRGNRD